MLRRLLAALGWPCEECTGALAVLIRIPHDRRGMDTVADALGLPSRQSAVRRLQKHGLPPAGPLRDWLRVVTLAAAWEAGGQTLQAQAYEAGVEPTTLHRAIVRVTGMTWQQVRGEGLEGVLERMSSEVGRRIRCGGTAG